MMQYYCMTVTLRCVDMTASVAMSVDVTATMNMTLTMTTIMHANMTSLRLSIIFDSAVRHTIVVA